MKVTLIITTYNWKEALELVLTSVKSQTVMPDEVIVADDGSRDDTKELVSEFSQDYPTKLLHSWQEDKGFRAAKSRNNAILKSTTDYIVMIDGDIMLHPNFIKNHIDAAQEGYFVQGGRVSLTKEHTAKQFYAFKLPNVFSSGVKNRKNTIENTLLSKLFTRKWNSDKSTRTCNFAAWKSDLIKVNGFNEAFEGWGREDSELVIRLLNFGLNRRYLKFAAVGYHLYHQENERASLAANDLLLEKTVSEALVRCEQGLDKYSA